MSAGSVFAELKRRNAIRRAGPLYLVGASLLSQLASTQMIGFIPALVLARVFELTPQGLKRDADVRPEDSAAPQTACRLDRSMLVAVLVIAPVHFGFDKLSCTPADGATR